jgi:hypothetical protein
MHTSQHKLFLKAGMNIISAVIAGLKVKVEGSKSVDASHQIPDTYLSYLLNNLFPILLITSSFWFLLMGKVCLPILTSLPSIVSIEFTAIRNDL